MSLITIPNTFSAGATIIASQHNSNFSTISADYNGNIDNTNIANGAAIAYSKLALTGNIVNADINASAAIVDSKLAQITTASKVSGTAITGLASLPAGAGVIPSANLGGGIIPSGGIILWSGTIATIPSGWVLCNGSNSTPDLRNLFVVGADADVVGVAKSTVTGSALQTSATGQLPSTTVTMSHNIKYFNGSVFGSGTGIYNDAAGTDLTASFGTGTKNIAVFYALAYIMKT